MNEVLQVFDEKCSEVESYLAVLEKLESPDIVLMNRSRGRSIRVFGDDSFKVMKATVFLLVYNLVESSTRSAFEALYREIGSKGLTVRELKAEYRSLWVDQLIAPMSKDSANFATFRSVAENILEQLVAERTADFSADRLRVSGNLDADTIRKICHRHGVSTNVHYQAKGGAELSTVKQQRNALGHGNVSFSACGQQYAVSDLKRIYRQSRTFVRSILRNVDRYIDSSSFLPA